MDDKELIERKSELKKKILTLEWDKGRSHLVFNKNNKLEEYKKELEEIDKKIGVETDENRL